MNQFADKCSASLFLAAMSLLVAAAILGTRALFLVSMALLAAAAIFAAIR